MKKSGRVYSIAVSPQRGQLKKEVPEAIFIAGRGIENDGHAGDWGRQVTCLSFESLRKANAEKGLKMGPGDFAENVLTEGLDLSSLVPGSRIRLGEDVMLEVTQVGKEDHPSIVSRSQPASFRRTLLRGSCGRKGQKGRCGGHRMKKRSGIFPGLFSAHSRYQSPATLMCSRISASETLVSSLLGRLLSISHAMSSE